MPEITKISHGLTIGDLKFGNARPGIVEATLKPGETMEQALDELDERLNAWHRKRYPHLYQEEERGFGDRPEHLKTKVEFGTAPIINIQHEKIQIAIENAKTLDELKDIKTVHPLLPVPLMEMYNKRLKELMK